MKMNDMIIYLGYASIAILLLLILKSVFKNKQEGFMGIGDEKDDEKQKSTKSTKSTKSDSNDPIEQGLEEAIDKLNNTTNAIANGYYLVKYRSDWEDLIVSVEDNINVITLSSLMILAKKMTDNPEDPSIATIIERLNTLNTFRTTLQDNMKYLDGMK